MNLNRSRRFLATSIAIASGLVLLALVVGLSSALAQGPQPAGEPVTVLDGSATEAFTYQGRLMEGSEPANGTYNLLITIWDAQEGGRQIAACPGNTGIAVQNGLFTLYLTPDRPMAEVFNGGPRWLELSVARADVGVYTTLPRQPISPVPYAWGLMPGAVISGAPSGQSGYLLGVSGAGYYPHAVGILSTVATGSAVRGEARTGTGLHGMTEDGIAVFAYDGGVQNGKGIAGYFHSTNGVALYGISQAPTDHPNIYAPAIKGESNNGVGVYGVSHAAGARGAGVMGYGVNGPGGRFLSHAGNIIEAHEATTINASATELRFRVSQAGDVYASGAFHPNGADFAEMLPSTAGLEPGDVLAIGDDGRLVRTTEAYQPTVVGVYSARPGLLGGAADGEDLSGKAPLAVVGVVPVKASAEGGAIRPGDLLTAAATPGHAMRAAADAPQGTVIGKALEPLAGGQGLIRMLVMLQ